MSTNPPDDRAKDAVFDAVEAMLRREVSSTLDRLAQHHCDSPIEVMLGGALWWCFRAWISPAWFCNSSDKFDAACEQHEFVFCPQYRWQNYRIDFAVGGKVWRPLFIECDGHDFHERTPEQAARDRLKDRTAQIAGIKILRFTGAEIHRDLGQCVSQILDAMQVRERLAS